MERAVLMFKAQTLFSTYTNVKVICYPCGVFFFHIISKSGHISGEKKKKLSSFF